MANAVRLLDFVAHWSCSLRSSFITAAKVFAPYLAFPQETGAKVAPLRGLQCTASGRLPLVMIISRAHMRGLLY